MSITAFNLDDQGNRVGLTMVPDLETLRIQQWPLDRYEIVPEDHVVRTERFDDPATPGIPGSGRTRVIYHSEPRVRPQSEMEASPDPGS